MTDIREKLPPLVSKLTDPMIESQAAAWINRRVGQCRLMLRDSEDPRDHVDQQGRDVNHNAGHRQAVAFFACSVDLVDGDRAEHDAHDRAEAAHRLFSDQYRRHGVHAAVVAAPGPGSG